MGYQLLVNDEFDDYPNAYWDVAQVSLVKASKTGAITFNAYKDQLSKGGRVIAQRIYQITPANFDKYFATSVLDNVNTDPYAQAYSLANNTFDWTRPDPVTALPVVQAYFNGAKVIQPGLPTDGTILSAIKPPN